MNTTSLKPRATKKPAAADPVSAVLRKAMNEHSAYWLAKNSGVNVAAILRFKNGLRSLTLPSVDKLAEVLGLELRAAAVSKK